MSNDEIISVKSIISGIFENISTSDVEKNSKVLSTWKRVVSSVTGCGEKLASHSRIIDLKNGTLLVEADHPGWIQMLQLNKKYILTGIQRAVPDLGVKNMVYRLKGSAAELHGVEKKRPTEEESYNRLQHKLESEQKKLDEMTVNVNADKTKDHELPDELKSLFDDLKQSMLTKPEK